MTGLIRGAHLLTNNIGHTSNHRLISFHSLRAEFNHVIMVFRDLEVEFADNAQTGCVPRNNLNLVLGPFQCSIRTLLGSASPQREDLLKLTIRAIFVLAFS